MNTACAPSVLRMRDGFGDLHMWRLEHTTRPCGIGLLGVGYTVVQPLEMHALVAQSLLASIQLVEYPGDAPFACIKRLFKI